MRRRWYSSQPTLMTIALLLFAAEVYANVFLDGTSRVVGIVVCAAAMLACVWRLSVNSRSETPGSH